MARPPASSTSINWSGGVTVALLTTALLLLGTGAALGQESDTLMMEFSSPVHHLPCTGDCIPFYWDGVYHLFVLKDGGWQHLRSTDLLNWEELPMALTKGAPEDADGEWCFTGHIMEHEGRFHIFYPGVNRNHPDGSMQMMHATSDDLIHFTKHPEETWGPDGIHYKTKAQSPEQEGSVEWPTFKDQCIVWNEKEQQWWMFISARHVDAKYPACPLAVSDDLINWTQVPPIRSLPIGDCTDVFRIGDWWYRISDVTYWRARDLAGPWSENDSGEGYVFDTHHLLVPKRLYDGTRHILIGGLRSMYGRMEYEGSVGSHCVSIPREVYADADGFLCTRPVAEASSVFSNTVLDLADKPKPDQEPLERAWVPKGETGPEAWDYEGDALVNLGAHHPERAHCSFDVPVDYMLKATVQLDHEAIFTVGFREQEGQPGSGYKLTVNRKTREAQIAGPASVWPREISMSPNEPITVQAFVVGSILECWINDAHAFCLRDFDFPEGKLSFEVVRGRARMLDLTVSVADGDE